MESRFIINEFDSLSDNQQEIITDLVSDMTTKWAVQLYSHCDSCSRQCDLIKVETEGGVIRICAKCKFKKNVFSIVAKGVKL